MLTFTPPITGKFRQYLPSLLAGAVGIAMSAAAAGFTASREDKLAQARFEAIAENHFMVMQNGLNEYVNRLRAVRALFDSSEGQVSRDSFEAFTRPLLQENAGIATLSWVPRVLGSERAEHEREAEQQGLANYRIKEMGEGRKMSVSP